MTEPALHCYDITTSSTLPTALAPHPFAVAARALHQARSLRADQAVLVSGESGAGKTEATKRVLQYLGYALRSHSLEERLMASNPLLEALGNAMTLRNDNSSRFGKYVRVLLDKATATRLLSANIDVFLLERSRVTGPQPNEANFHFLHQVQQSEPALAAHSFRWLNGMCPVSAGQWARTKASLETIGVTPSEITTLRHVGAAILWLGELKFDAKGDGSCVAPVCEPALGWIALYLGVTSEDVLQCCCFETLDTRKGGTFLARPLNPIKASLQRDALARALYVALWTWAVGKVNQSLSTDGAELGDSSALETLSIGVLDIFGFEVMPANNLEQLLINYANERLHSLFLDAALKAEQAIYIAEGVKWSAVSYKNNDSIVAYVGNVVLPFLDDATQLNGDAASMLAQLLQRKHECTTVDARKTQFQIVHFAGPVTYSASQMPSANLDTLPINAVALGSSSTDSLIASWFTNLEHNESSSVPSTPTATNRSPSGESARRGSVSGRGSPFVGRKAAGARKASVGLKFRGQLHALMEELNRTQCHFIRAVKPNSEKKALFFVASPTVRTQLEQGGVLEVAKVRQAGFEIHLPHGVFQDRYVGMLPPAAEEGTTWFKGRTLMMFKTGLQTRLDQELGARVCAASLIQRNLRVGAVNAKLQRCVRAALIVARQGEAQRQRRLYAALKLQRFYRCTKKNRRMKRLVVAALVVARWCEKQRSVYKRLEKEESEKKKQSKQAAKTPASPSSSSPPRPIAGASPHLSTVSSFREAGPSTPSVARKSPPSEQPKSVTRAPLPWLECGLVNQLIESTSQWAARTLGMDSSYHLYVLDGSPLAVVLHLGCQWTVERLPQQENCFAVQVPALGRVVFSCPNYMHWIQMLEHAATQPKTESFAAKPASAIQNPSRYTRVADLPADAAKLVQEMGVAPDVAQAHFGVLLAVVGRALNIPLLPRVAEGIEHFCSSSSSSFSPQIATKDVQKALKGKLLYQNKCLIMVNKSVAVKIAALDGSPNSESMERECRILSALQHHPHPNVVHLQNAYRASMSLSLAKSQCDEIWLTMDYVDSVPLSSIQKHWKWSAPQVGFVLAQLASAVSFLHANAVTHRAISPHNILLNDKGLVTLVDFGSAANVPSVPPYLLGMHGAPFFAAPEMVTGPFHSVPVDIYSVGVLVYWMLSGALPTLSPGTKASRGASLYCMFSVGAGFEVCKFDDRALSSAASDFIRMCCAHDPFKRPSAQSLLSHPLVVQKCGSVDLKKVVATCKREKAFDKIL